MNGCLKFEFEFRAKPSRF